MLENTVCSALEYCKIYSGIFTYIQGQMNYFLKNIIFNSEKEKRNSYFSFLQKSILIPNGVDQDYIDALKCSRKMFNSNKVNLFFLAVSIK